MKKYNKLFAILFAVLGVTTLKAQTNIIADWDGGSNTGKPTTFGWASSYGSRSWGALNGGGARVTNTYSGYKKEDGSAYSYVADSEPSTQILWIRYNSNSETYTYTFQGLEAGKVYTFSGLVGWHNNSNAPTFTITVNGDKELAKISKYCGTKQMLYPFSVDFYVPSDNTSEDFTLKFNSNQGGDNMEALSALSIVENADFANASESTPYDATSWLSNPGFENVSGGAGSINTPSGWTIKHSLSGWLDGTGNTTNPSEGSKCYNIWAGTVNSIDMYQTVTLPAGKYEVLADLRIDNMSLVTDQGVYAKVGGIVSKSGTIQTVASPWNSLEGWNTLTTTFNNGSESDVVIGISSTGTGSGSAGWFQADNVRLMYLGYDLTEANKALEALIEAAQKIIDANEVSPKSIEKLNQAIAAAQSVVQTEEAIAQASENLSGAMTAADETKEACAEYRSILALSESMYTNSTADDKSTFKAAIDKAKDDFNAAENSEAIRTISVELQNAQKTYCLVAAPTEGHPFDMTHLIVNPKFDQDKTGWNSDGGAQNKAIASNKPEPITGKFYENWNPSNFTGSIYQEISGLPNGTYKLKAAAFGNNAVLFANDATTQMADNDNTPAWYEVEVKVSGGTLKFGVQNNNNTGWMGIDNVSLQFIAALDLSEFISAYEAALASAVAARDNAEYTHITGIERTNLVNAIDQPIAEETKEAYQEATQSLANATNAFIAAKSDYDILAAEIIIAKGLGMTDDRINGITAGKTGAVAYPDLKVDEYNYIINDVYTESATLGSWTEDFAEDLNGEGYKANGSTYFNEWGNATRTAKQTVKLPAGDYAIYSIGRGQSGTSGYLYYKIGDTTNQVDFIMKGNRGRGVDVDGVATFSDEATYNCNGEGFGWEYRFITFHLDAETEVEIGVSATFANAWVSIYAPVLLTDPSSKKALLLSQIASLLENVPSGIMNKDVETTLNTKKTVAQNASNANTTAELDEIYTEFKNAVDAANTSIADYAAILTYISKANNIDESIAAAYKTQYDDRTLAESAVTVFQTLEVATYNYVMANFTYDVEMEAGAWIPEGPVGSLSGQHYDGSGTSSYLEQSSAAWGQSAWSISYKQDKTLPAGDYVFKVAGRRASGTGNTLSLVVTNINDPGNPVELGMVNDFPEGDTGLGINKNGITSFDAGDEAGFANNNNGRGWQWRYVKFTLTSETTVQVAVEAEATTTHQWISFCDATLQMTEDTYLDANMGALDAPTAAAEALVDTKPMGTAENNDLKAALALPVTTGAELLAKIEALNIAVANANAWIPKYNEAKAPLVAALERFETDYNDGANGCLYHLQKAAWSTVIEKVQAAAEAKDATNSFAGFEAATTDLVAALDAAQASINMYAKLKAEIAYAQAYTPLIEGNAADHTAAITAAQNAYDAAETADASELILAMQNYKELDYTYVTDTYTMPYKLGDWTGSTGTGKSEHWSGNAETTYFDYSRYSGEAKAYEATQTITLPAGEYVLMAAGRASEVEGTEAYIKVDDNKVNFNTKGSYGLGIDTDGKANFSADGTYGRDGEGYGWEYRFIEFTLTEETEVTLVAGMNIADSYNPLSWAGVCTPQLFTTPLSGAKNNLQKAIDAAEATLAAYPIGEEAFQISENSDAYKVLSQAIVTAKGYLGESNIGVLEEATETLNAAVETFETSYVLNAPSEGQRFYIKIATEGHSKLENAILATLGATGDNNPTGYGLNANNAVKGYLNQAFTFTQVEGNLYNISIERKEGTVYLTYGALNGSAAGWKNQQIQATTDAEKKGEFKIVPTGKNGILKIFNTIDNNYLDCQDGGSIYTDTSISNEEFAFELAPEHEVALSISSAGWATLILPFNAEIPEGVRAFSCFGSDEDNVLALTEATGTFAANTPYLVSGTGKHVFSGYGLAQQDTCIVGLFTGTYVDYQTTANSNTYVLQKHDDEVAFYLVGESAQPVVKPYRIYMTYEAPAGETAAPMFRIGRGATGIEDAEWTMDNGQWTIYDLMGRKVTTMEKGNMYIVNGKKVVIK